MTEATTTDILVQYLRGGEDRPPRKSSKIRSGLIADRWTQARVPFIMIRQVAMDGVLVRIANSVLDKIHLLDNYIQGNDIILVPWPGKQVTDVFVIDDPDRIQNILDLHAEGASNGKK